MRLKAELPLIHRLPGQYYYKGLSKIQVCKFLKPFYGYHRHLFYTIEGLLGLQFCYLGLLLLQSL